VNQSRREAGWFAPEILDALSARVGVLDVRGTILAVNRAWRASATANGVGIHGALEGGNYLEVCDSATGPQSEEAWALARAIRACLRGEQDELALDYPSESPGGQRWFVARVVRFVVNGSVSVAVSHEDVTGRKLAEGHLAESEARTRALLDSAVDAVLTIDERGLIQSFNPAAERMFGYTAAEVVGRNVHLLMPSPYREEHDGYLARYRATGERKIIGIGREVTARRKDGTVFPIDLSVAEARLGEWRVFVGTIRDLSERKRAEQALRDNQKSLEKAVAELQAKNEEIRAMTQQLWHTAKLASVGELAASIAHELNNPLATVSLRIESTLARTPADDPRRRALEVVAQETKRMGELVSNLLQFSRRGREESSTLDLRQELAGAVELIQHHLRKRQIAVAKEFAPDTPTIYADRQKLRQVFLNLLTNASDAMPEGGTLTIRTVPAVLANGQPGVRIEFTDTGVGIPPEHLSRVMEPFFTTKEEGKGTGLGLPICRRVVQEHHGSLEIFSEVRKGTTVRIILAVRNGTNVKGLGNPAPVK
jgi:PAS domain S-box-containing protein